MLKIKHTDNPRLVRMNLTQFRREQLTVCQFACSQGAVPALDCPDQWHLLADYIADVPRVFPDVVALGLRWVYIYSMDNQRGQKLQTADGISWYFQQSDGEYIFGIGISIQALAAGKDYTLSLFLHELAHICENTEVTGADIEIAEHDADFNGTLDKLLKRYNKVCGTALKPVQAPNSPLQAVFRFWNEVMRQNGLGRLLGDFTRFQSMKGGKRHEETENTDSGRQTRVGSVSA